MDGTVRQTALITGASSGIGEELAHIAAERGMDLVLVARNGAKLRAIAQELQGKHGVSVRVIEADLAEPAAPQRLHDEVQTAGIAIDILVNNAGFGFQGRAIDLSMDAQSEMIEVNVTALTKLARLFAPAMVARGQGRILNVGSTASFQPGPYMAVYCATKAYVLSFSEALAEELAGTGVTVTCLCPGATRTGFAAAAKMENSRLFKMGAMTSRAVAEQGFAAMMAGRRTIVTGLRNQVTALSVRFTPRPVVLKIARALMAN